MQDYRDVLAEILIDETTLQSRVAELGAEISRDYAGTQNLLLICILRGGVPFLVDLSRHLTVPHMMDFMAVSSYGAGRRDSDGNVRVVFDLQTNIMGKHVLLVEDIVDSGHTIASVLGMLGTRQPATSESLHACWTRLNAGRQKSRFTTEASQYQIDSCSDMAWTWMSIIGTCPSLVWLIWRKYRPD